MTLMGHRVYLEEGDRLVFAVSLDWPGWCRSARSADLALAQLHAYAPRYGAIVGVGVGVDAIDSEFDVVGSVRGNATTDFGAPRVMGPWDDEILTDRERRAHVDVLASCWRYFDHVVESSGEDLLKGPRGGGRNRDAVVNHVREAERHFAPKVGARIAPRTPWPVQRELLTTQLLHGPADPRWPVGFALRIIAWHVVDHAWEIEDKALP